MHDYGNLLILATLWLLYFLSHSLLASLTAKHWVAKRYPAFMPWYRISFNVLAVLLLLPPLGLMWHWRSSPLWEFNAALTWFTYGLTLLAILGFLWSTRYYDSGEFIGLRQLRLRIREVHDQDNFHISPLHRYVRHPWYSLALVLIWSREMDAAMLVSAIMMSLYFIYGSRIEERKLVVYHGEVYQRYQSLVPGLLPRPWRYLSREAAAALVAGARLQ
ncbi:MAG: hypothetical protein DIZ77_18645 [endosymbiont of Seepiophila jonesi]|uniref:Uncharacterized protein n=1 Tax=endosymbiont of Lamellibrachia luymesi TaxID=2200907 RepID=A0A370DZJ1_9GAMM|nr:MAG: hypothetical protein DIZ77_18645 [endosymbiont of Seepiophila jonesi]RDH92155.1 MAG: hypothetical protein DIZ79_04285 [endosymbiont of Lamellibrachia luymesi]